MKKELLFILFTLAFSSCSEIEQPQVELAQTWSLIGYNCSFCSEPDVFNPIETDTTYQYIIRPDSSFTKILGEVELFGQIELKRSQEGQTYYEFQYDDFSVQLDKQADGFGFIHYCGQPIEIIQLTEEGRLKGNWGDCDGPNLIFERL